MDGMTPRSYYTSAQRTYGAKGNPDLAKILREQVYLSDIPNYLMSERASTLEGLDAEQDRLSEQLLNELGLSVKRR